jgi:hypothetical protein
MQNLKRCKGCGEDKPLDAFNLYGKRRPGALRSKCKVCTVEENTARNKLNPQRATQATLRWQKRHPERAAAFTAKRRAQKNNATPSWVKDSEWEHFVHDEVYEAAKLRTLATKVKHEVDHQVPLISDVVCGLHCAANFQVLTKYENIAKSNSWVL